MGFIGAFFAAGRGSGYHLGILSGNEARGMVAAPFEIRSVIV
jgi:hypothetical protein